MSKVEFLTTTAVPAPSGERNLRGIVLGIAVSCIGCKDMTKFVAFGRDIENNSQAFVRYCTAKGSKEMGISDPLANGAVMNKEGNPVRGDIFITHSGAVGIVSAIRGDRIQTIDVIDGEVVRKPGGRLLTDISGYIGF